MQGLLTTRVCILTGTYPFVLLGINSKNNTAYQGWNERAAPDLDKPCYFRFSADKRATPQKWHCPRMIMGYGFVLSDRKSALTKDNICGFRPLIEHQLSFVVFLFIRTSNLHLIQKSFYSRYPYFRLKERFVAMRIPLITNYASIWARLL